MRSGRDASVGWVEKGNYDLGLAWYRETTFRQEAEPRGVIFWIEIFEGLVRPALDNRDWDYRGVSIWCRPVSQKTLPRNIDKNSLGRVI